MKLRLQVELGPESSFPFEYQGTTVNVGRDPEGELHFDGTHAQAVSWNHARIELTSRGAFLNDLGSTNGTLLNDKRVAVRTAVRAGDRIQLGFTGPILRVLEVDLRAAPDPVAANKPTLPEPKEPAARPASPPRFSPAPEHEEFIAAVRRRERRSFYAWTGGGILVLLLLGIFFARRGDKDTPKTDPGENKQIAAAPPKAAPDAGALPIVPPQPKANVEPPKNPPVNPNDGAAKNPPVNPNDGAPKNPPIEKAAPPAEVMPLVEHRDIGRYVQPQKGPPSVLLARQRETQPWGRLRPDQRIHTGTYLVSMPGYRSQVDLESGVQLVLWGNVPEFSNESLVLESEIVLHVPPAGFDADLTLDHGRLLILNYKPKGEPARIRLRFLQEVRDITLQDPKAEVVAEGWGLIPPGEQFKRAGGSQPLEVLGLFTRGKVDIKAGARSFSITDPSLLVWTNKQTAPQEPQKLPKQPSWWTDRIAADKDRPELVDVLLALEDFDTYLKPDKAALDVIRTRTQEAADPRVRAVGVFFLQALDGLAYLIDALEDPRSPQVRGTAREALQRWMARGVEHDQELYRTLQEKKAYSADKAELIVRLLYPLTPQDVQRPETYEQLLSWLNHENLAIRELALWHLSLLVPEAAKTILYDPTGNEDQRKPAWEQWQKFLKEKGAPALKQVR